MEGGGRDDTSVQVALRIRPQNASEKIDLCHTCTSVTPGHPQVVLGKDKAFTYDFVFDVTSQQDGIYAGTGQPLIEGCLEGYNATILAYGQTGSGKTYTMGTSFDTSVNEQQIGIIPRAVRHLFNGINKRRKDAEDNAQPQPEFKVTAQFLELYNEEIIDLLDIENKGKKNIRVHEDHDGNIFLSGVVSRTIGDAQSCMDLLEEGALSRTTAATNMNATSSRSHAIFTIFIKHYRLAASCEGEEFETLNAKFNFVDLAGSERLKRTGATGDRQKEGISINQGLLSLGNVISALGDKMKRGSHVPYRDSKLTRLLQDSLGGNSRTLMIACCSPSDRDFMETLNTLKYANRARNIKNKVMVNQDKASKQIAMLRQEIQELQLELLEYKQGKRVANDSGEHMTDTFKELEMLRGENENLRMRIKAVQKNVDSQSIQLTELKVSSVLAHVADGEKESIKEIIFNYEKQIQDLSNKVAESEEVSNAAIRRAQTVSRLAMSPGGAEDEPVYSLLDVARQQIKKEKKIVKQSKKKKNKKLTFEEKEMSATTPESEDAEKVDEEKAEGEKIDEEKEKEEEKYENGNEEKAEGEKIDEEKEEEKGEEKDEHGDEENGTTVEDEEIEDEEDEEDENESNTDSDDEQNLLNQSLKEEEGMQDDINNLDTDITIKQKLIEELEHSQLRLNALKQQYEQKMSLLHNKIKETEVERDKVLKNIGNVDVKAQEKSNEVRKQYERRINQMQKELAKLHNSKREHQRLLKTKEQNESQLKLMRAELNDMKRMKVKMMRRMRDETSRNKRMETKLNQQMENVLKENRKKEFQLKRLQQEKQQRDIVLKRKQEELKAIRRQARPVSGRNNQSAITSNNNNNSKASRPTTLQTQFQQPANPLNATFVVDSNNDQPPIPQTPPPASDSKRFGSPSKIARSPAVSKKAKQKWEILERKLTDLAIRMKNVAQMENDMERWLAERDRVSRQLDSAKRRKELAEKKNNQEDVTEINGQLEGLEAHLEYIQEHVTASQGTIMGMEDAGEGINHVDIITSCTSNESRYILQHFYTKSVETAQELANKDAAYKEIQIKLEAMEKHCEVQQQLLQHACKLGKGMDPLTVDEDEPTEEDEEKTAQEAPIISTIRKSRRKTALPEELLHPKDKAKSPPPKVVEISLDEENNEETSTTTASDVPKKKKKDIAETFQLDDKTLQKLIELEKSLKDKKKLAPPGGVATEGVGEEGVSRTGSFSDRSRDDANIGKFSRNTRATRSARPFPKSASTTNLKPTAAKRASSNRSSPIVERRTVGEPTTSTTASSGDSDASNDVFKRLTSNLPKENDPDVGQILPSKSVQGKPDALVCMYTASGHTNAVLSLDVHENLMVTGSKDRTAKIWDLTQNEEIMSLNQHKRDVLAVKFCPAKSSVFTVYQSTIKLWDLRQGTVVKTLSSGLFQSMGEASIMDLGLNKDGTVLYSAIGNVVKIIDLRTYSTIGKLTGHTGTVTCLLVADTGHHHDNIITGSKDHSIKIFEVVDEVASSQVPRQNLEPPHYDGVQSLAMRDKLLFSGSRDNTIKRWNYNNHNLEEHLTSSHRDWVTALNFVPNEDILISADRRGIVKLWEASSCKSLSGDIAAHGKSINSIKCNDSRIFTASSDRLVRIWKPSPILLDEMRANDSI